MLKTSNDARAYFKDNGLEYSDLTRNNVQKLRGYINSKMVDGKYMDGTLRCRQRAEFQGTEPFWAGIKCRSFYFTDREAVSFNRDGFIGFAGWASSKHVRPIIDGFEEWADWMVNNKSGTLTEGQ